MYIFMYACMDKHNHACMHAGTIYIYMYVYACMHAGPSIHAPEQKWWMPN